jgi:hypothetical protein
MRKEPIMARQLAGALAFTLALALAGQPALAKGSRGGGRSGGSHAVSRGGHSSHSAGKAVRGYSGHRSSPRPYPSTGRVAERRHPRAGTGRAWTYRRSYRGTGYRPYYSGHRYYRRPYSYGSIYFDFGWPYYYYAPWPYYSYYYPEYGYPGAWVGDDVPDYAPDDAAVDADGEATNDYAPADRPNPDLGQIRLEVRPEDASVYVDDEFRGSASESRALELPPGRHVIELVRPGYRIERRELTVVRGTNPDVLVEMQQPR